MDQEAKSYLHFVFDFYKVIKQHNITLVYEGDITHQLTKAFTTLAESNMVKEEESGSVQRKVFHVMVECLQNLCKHAEESQQMEHLYSSRGIFIVSRNDDEYCVTTGNTVEIEKIDGLKSMLDHINSLDKDQLNELYKKQIKDGVLSEKGGAGLGFIDIARKTGKKLDFFFQPIDEKVSFFIMTSTIPRT